MKCPVCPNQKVSKSSEGLQCKKCGYINKTKGLTMEEIEKEMDEVEK